MPGRTGTHDIAFLLATTNPVTNGSLSFQEIADALDADTAAYTGIVRDQLADLATFKSGEGARIGAYGGSAAGSLMKVGEYGRAPTQRAAAVAALGFPLDKYQYNVGWTAEWLKRKSAADFARSTQAVQQGWAQRVTAEIKRAIFLPLNYNFTDHLVDNSVLAVKRLVNADSAVIPNGPNGETFTGSSHTHYLGSAALDIAAVNANLAHLTEHGHTSRVRMYIAAANETAFRALVGFTPYTDPRLILGTQANQPGARLDITKTDNRAIGLFGVAEIWVKPWMIANYLFSFDAGSPNKTLRVREDQPGSMNIQRAAQFEDHPLHVDFFESYFGIGVETRTNGVVTYFANATYAAPTITNP
jgi:hypothetical protein